MGRLVDATIAILGESGYSQLTVAAVCARAELSQGALFRHFGTRHTLIAAATEVVCRRHLALLSSGLVGLRSRTDAAAVEGLIRSLREAARTPEHAAFHEVMVAARSNAELHTLVAPTLEHFEQLLLEEIATLAGAGPGATRLGTVVISIMHMLDSEAVTAAVYDHPPLVDDRTDWLVGVLQRELVVVGAVEDVVGVADPSNAPARDPLVHDLPVFLRNVRVDEEVVEPVRTALRVPVLRAREDEVGLEPFLLAQTHEVQAPAQVGEHPQG